MWESLGLSALNPALLWGLSLISLPILIHLLNKRKFKRIEWAAMDFLLEADRRNRRRLRMEELLLLLLRCLALIFLTLMAARLLFKPENPSGGLLRSARLERLILLDDSPSMGARAPGKVSFEEAKGGLKEFIRRLASERPGDTITLLTTSRPDTPILRGRMVVAEQAEDLARTAGAVSLSSQPAHLPQALLALEQHLGERGGPANRLVYILSDFRRYDWLEKGAKEIQGRLAALRAKASALYLLDLGSETLPNLTLTALASSEGILVAGVPARFEATVKNFGEEEVGESEVSFNGAGASPVKALLPAIPAGGQATVPFTFTFREPGAYPLQAETGNDPLPFDNLRYCAAHVLEGIPILLVDGEPSPEYGESEVFFLERALAPPGHFLSGNLLKTVTESQWENLSLDEFRIIFLCNVYRISSDRAASLAQWVRGGGGLVFFPGDQVDEVSYNENLFSRAGLFPMKISGVRGDERERRWAHWSEKASTHPILAIFQGAQNPFLKQVKFFRWWAGQVPEEDQSSGASRILAALTDPDASPALVEKRLGEGRILALAFPADGEWSSWPADPSFVVSVLEMVRYIARSPVGRPEILLGAPLGGALDPATYQPQVRVTPPEAAKALVARAAPSEDGRSSVWSFSDTGQRGFYRLQFTRHGGAEETRLYAANADPAEGDLRRADETELRRSWGDTDLRYGRGLGPFAEGGAGTQVEVWRAFWYALLAVLCLELFLAGWFGRRR